MTIEELLKELLGKHFSRVIEDNLNFIKKSGRSEIEIRNTFEFLLKLGLTQEKIAINAQLLIRNQDEIKRNFNFLEILGIARNKIFTYPRFLGMNWNTVQSNFNFLKSLLSILTK